jgi:hypothetical protein
LQKASILDSDLATAVTTGFDASSFLALDFSVPWLSILFSNYGYALTASCSASQGCSILHFFLT